MAQFDSLLIWHITFHLAISLTIYYLFSLTIVLPNVFGITKLREKKLNADASFMFCDNNIEINLKQAYSQSVAELLFEGV